MLHAAASEVTASPQEVMQEIRGQSANVCVGTHALLVIKTGGGEDG